MEIKTLTFFSNYYNHHQKALCDEWAALLGPGFTFVETEPIEGFRSTMGWGHEDVPPYVLRTYLNDKSYNRALKLGRTSDVVVMGTAPEIFIEERLKLNKITFRYSERPLKEGFIKFFIPRLTKKYLHHEMDRGTKQTGVKRIRIHDLRHSHISLLIDMGFSAIAIADRVGHESIDITYNYAHLF